MVHDHLLNRREHDKVHYQIEHELYQKDNMKKIDNKDKMKKIDNKDKMRKIDNKDHKVRNYSNYSMKVLHLSLLNDFHDISDNHHKNDRNHIRIEIDYNSD